MGLAEGLWLSQLAAIGLMPALGGVVVVSFPDQGIRLPLRAIGPQQAAEGEPFPGAELEEGADVLRGKGVQGPIAAVF